MWKEMEQLDLSIVHYSMCQGKETHYYYLGVVGLENINLRSDG